MSNSYKGCENQLNYTNKNNPKMYKESGLVIWGCCNKLPWTEWLKQQIFIYHSSGGCEFWNQGASMAGWQQGPSSWFPHLVDKEMERKQTLVSLLTKAHKLLLWRTSPSWTNNLLISSHCCKDFNTLVLRRHKHLVHNRKQTKNTNNILFLRGLH